jgi:hypothetical protein
VHDYSFLTHTRWPARKTGRRQWIVLVRVTFGNA